MENRFEIFSTSVTHLVKTLQLLKSRKMAQYDLKGTTCLCLCQILASENGLTASELSVKGDIDKAQVSRCMSELIEKGFACREDENGRRYKQRYLLTDAGRVAAHDIVKTTNRIQDLAEGGISHEELAAFYRVLDRMCDNFEMLREQISEDE